MHNYFKKIIVRRYEDPLSKYLYMIDLLDRNERLFYKTLSENLEELMPIVYTPTVGLACQKFGYAFKKPQVLMQQYKKDKVCRIQLFYIKRPGPPCFKSIRLISGTFYYHPRQRSCLRYLTKLARK